MKAVTTRRLFSDAIQKSKVPPYVQAYMADIDSTRQLLHDRGMPCLDLTDLKSAYEQWERLKLEDRSDNALRLKHLESSLTPLHQLPNQLSPETPIGFKPIVQRCVHAESNNTSLEDHMTTLRHHGLLTLKKEANHQCFYLNGVAVSLLNALEKYVRAILLGHRFVPLVLPSTIRSWLLQQVNPDYSRCWHLSGDEDDRSRLTLIGNALPAYLAVLTRRSLGKRTNLPVQLFSIAPLYSRRSDLNKEYTLFNCEQSTTATLLALFDASCSSPKDEADSIVEQVHRVAESILINLEVPYWRCQVASKCLSPDEAARIDLQFTSFSGDQQDLVTVRTYGDYLCKKLQITKDDVENNQRYPHLVYAEFHLHRVLAAIVERCWSTRTIPFVPDKLQHVN